MQPRPAARSRTPILAVPAVALIALLSFAAGRFGSVASQPGGSHGANAFPSAAAPSRSPRPTPTILPTRTPTRAAGPCVVPDAVPAAGAPVATPAVESSEVSMVFASHTYSLGADGAVVARNDIQTDWAMGLWYVAAGAGEARLLAETVDGMVLPLALSPAGDRVVVWWLPERRYQDELACVSGIYELSVADGTSRLLVSSDWSVERDGEGSPVFETVGRGIIWQGPDYEQQPRAYVLPEAGYSADGTSLALARSGIIDLYTLLEEPRVVRSHLGECRDWAWSATGAVFVAGCEGMTSAWYVNAGEGFAPESVAIPYPPAARSFLHDPSTGREIGLMPDGRIRVTRWHGFATGCESPGCTLPPLGWSMTTFDASTGAATFDAAEVDFLVNASETHEAHLSADGSWVVANVDDGTRTLRLGSGAISTGPSFGTLVGRALDGSFQYAARFDESETRVIVSSFDAAGDRARVTSITFAAGEAVIEPEYSFPALFVVRPAS